ncbi:hypothetical protein SSKA14_4396 [Stenotrophomonas sp. SKA14]|nr:hypothetical protein SSKA14_4396 [Stenotrophomonas sp. SKA14]
MDVSLVQGNPGFLIGALWRHRARQKSSTPLRRQLRASYNPVVQSTNGIPGGTMKNGMLGASLLLTAALAAPFACAAQGGSLKSDAKATAKELRALGEPMDRCSLAAITSDASVVTGTYGGSVLRPGDRILSINGQDVAGQSSSVLSAALRRIAPDATVAVVVERAGTRTDLSLPCGNSRSRMEALLNSLDAAARGNYGACINALGDRKDLGAQGAILRARCATAASSVGPAGQAEWTYEALKLGIAEAQWDAGARSNLIDVMRRQQVQINKYLGEDRYAALVAGTERWPGAETLYKRTDVDQGQLRRIAQDAVRGRLLDPDSARIDMPYGFLRGSWRPMLQKEVDGYWTCGTVNAKNRMGGYVGSTAFVVVLGQEGQVKYVELGNGRDLDILGTQCAKAVAYLPPAPVEHEARASSGSPGSLADELKQLAELKASGALTEAEFEAAKQRVLSSGKTP